MWGADSIVSEAYTRIGAADVVLNNLQHTTQTDCIPPVKTRTSMWLWFFKRFITSGLWSPSC